MLKANGSIDRYKAKLVAKGYSQLERVDFEETFNPVVKATTIRVVLSSYDIIVTGSHTTLISKIIGELGKEFAMEDLGPLHFFLGIEVTYFTGGIYLNQSKYAAELLVKISMALAKPISTPLTQKHGLQEVVDNPVDASLYKSIVGSLQYLTLTRPDIAYVVNLASQFMQSPNNTHY
ncbi:uncharacterized mitochondrial protein AtMg00810-like [Nicotiana sylvestris]|uniref:uncharacterized mitochondrial protein AtMg00810-like n=1 Tax=Nicotiana sylvestris TaxID=4096 RepID=UPI00388C9176